MCFLRWNRVKVEKSVTRAKKLLKNANTGYETSRGVKCLQCEASLWGIDGNAS